MARPAGILFPFAKSPWVFLKPAQGSRDSLSDGQFGFPSQTANPGAIKKNKWAVSNPSAFPSGIGSLGVEAELLGDAIDAVIHTYIFIRTQIENIHFFVGFLNGHLHGVQAVLNVKVRLFLFAVAQNVEGVGIFPQAFVKIKNVAVCITLSQNGHKPKDPSLKPKALAIGLNHSFTRQLGSSVN